MDTTSKILLIGGSVTVGAGLIWLVYRTSQGLPILPSANVPTTTPPSPLTSSAVTPSGLPANMPSYGLTLPASYTARCGTAYFNAGDWPGKSGYVVVVKYVDGMFSTLYPQLVSVAPTFTTGMIVGGYDCATKTVAAPIYTYTVQAGDTLSAIAACDQTTVSALASLNGISNPDLINIDQVLKLPNPLQCQPSTGSSSAPPSRSSGSAQEPSNGALYQVSGSSKIYVYWTSDHQLHWICDSATFNQLGLSYTDLHIVSQLPASVGSTICHTTTEKLTYCQFDAQATKNGSYTFGPPPSPQYIQDGAVFWVPGTSTIWIVFAKQLFPVLDLCALHQLGKSCGDVQPVSALPNLPKLTGTQNAYSCSTSGSGGPILG